MNLRDIFNPFEKLSGVRNVPPGRRQFDFSSCNNSVPELHEARVNWDMCSVRPPGWVSVPTTPTYKLSYHLQYRTERHAAINLRQTAKIVTAEGGFTCQDNLGWKLISPGEKCTNKTQKQAAMDGLAKTLNHLVD